MLPAQAPDSSQEDEPGMHLSLMMRHWRLMDVNKPWVFRWCTGACVHRAYKLIFSVYDLCCGWFNRLLKFCCLGGAYHSAVELDGKEYSFGGHHDDYMGIAGMDKPFHVMRSETLAKLNKPGISDSQRDQLQGQLDQLPALHKRIVIGWWLGSKTQFEELLSHFKDEHGYVGPSYQLLSRNCNHFARSLTSELERQHKLFQPAPGFKKAAENMADMSMRITEFAKCCCCPCVRRHLDMQVPPAPHQLNVFRGAAQKCGTRVLPAAPPPTSSAGHAAAHTNSADQTIGVQQQGQRQQGQQGLAVAAPDVASEQEAGEGCSVKNGGACEQEAGGCSVKHGGALHVVGSSSRRQSGAGTNNTNTNNSGGGVRTAVLPPGLVTANSVVNSVT